METAEITQFQNKILAWYDHNARILPWREYPSPYRVWISEIMLQQTRVETVKPYFENFMQEVPSVEALADISEEKLFKLWEGLGYYSRAKNLKKAAGVILEEYHGQLPMDINSLKGLPGIGPYSAGAIASIAFGQKVPAIDGNVLRVMARVTANKGDITNQSVKKEIENLVSEILPGERAGDFNQALMELGAVVCLPAGTLKCPECPLHLLCQGYQQGIAGMLPVKPQKAPRKIERKTIMVIDNGGKIALRKRPGEGLLANLWEFPHVDGHLSFEECKTVLEKWQIPFYRIVRLQEAKHLFTHLEWQMIGYSIETDIMGEELEFAWATKEEIKQKYSIPSVFKAYLKYL